MLTTQGSLSNQHPPQPQGEIGRGNTDEPAVVEEELNLVLDHAHREAARPLAATEYFNQIWNRDIGQFPDGRHLSALVSRTKRLFIETAAAWQNPH
jgi:hypothetical protein